MGTVWRNPIAVVCGLVAAGVTVGLGETIGMIAFPVPVGTDLSTPEAIARAMDAIPLGAKVAVVASWGVGAFVGGLVVSAIARRAKMTTGLVFGVLFLLVTFANLQMVPHPTWMWVVGLLEVLPAALLGSWLRGRDPARGGEAIVEPGEV